MSESDQLSSRNHVVHPRCWWCWKPMVLKRVDPTRLDHYKGKFECETCGRTKKRVIRIRVTIHFASEISAWLSSLLPLPSPPKQTQRAEAGGEEYVRFTSENGISQPRCHVCFVPIADSVVELIRRTIAMPTAAAASDRAAGPGPCAARDRCRAPVLRRLYAAPAQSYGCETLQARRDGRR